MQAKHLGSNISKKKPDYEKSTENGLSVFRELCVSTCSTQSTYWVLQKVLHPPFLRQSREVLGLRERLKKTV